MGYYIEVPSNRDKARLICELHGARRATKTEAEAVVVSPNEAPIVVVNNGPFEAAAFAYNREEWDQFHQSDDHRMREYVIIDRIKAETLTSYTRSQVNA